MLFLVFLYSLFCFFAPNKQRMKFERCVQGAKNSSAMMEILTNKLLEPISEHTASYVDDIFLLSDGQGEEGFDKHLNLMEKLFIFLSY